MKSAQNIGNQKSKNILLICNLSCILFILANTIFFHGLEDLNYIKLKIKYSDAKGNNSDNEIIIIHYTFCLSQKLDHY